MNTKRILLFNTSPRKTGTSYSFARTIAGLAEDLGSTAEIVHTIDYFDRKEDFNKIKGMLSQKDIIAVVSPVYSDTLPYQGIWLLEKLADECADELSGKCIFAVGQCGFPDITRVEPLLNSCRLFAEETGMKWLGGLAYGGGAMLNGAFLEDLGKRGQKIIAGFRLALENILKEEKIDKRAQELITLRIPQIIYWFMAVYMNNRIKKQARQNGNVDCAKKVYLE